MTRIAKTLTLAGTLCGLVGIGAATAALTQTVSQTDKSFAESELTISAGTTVNFVNEDSVKHNILVRKMKYNSGTQAPGETVAVTFDKAGKYKVRCGIHPKMKMKVIVN